MHVLTLTPFYPTVADDANGCFIAEPLEALARRGVRNSIFAVVPFYRESHAIHPNAPTALTVRYASIPGRWGLSTAGAFLFSSILNPVRELHGVTPIDLIHAHAPLPCGHAAMLLSREIGVPFVLSVHGLDAYSVRQATGRAGEWCRRVSRLVFQSANRVLCISEHVRDQVLHGTPGCKTAVVYNSTDPVRFSPPDAEHPGPPRVVSVGNLIPIKGHAALLRAVAAAGATVECDIVGDGPEKAHLMRLSAELKLNGRVHFLGRKGREEVADRLRWATLFALPSTYEGLGCVYLEAMACAKAAIACRGQGIEEVIHHGSDGWLVGPDNLEELTQGLTTLLDNTVLRKHIGSNARATILQGFTLNHQAERLLQLYRECVV